MPPSIDIAPTLSGPVVTKWFDYLTEPEEMVWDGRLEINLPDFPDVTFRWYPEKIEAVTKDGITPLYTGMPIWNTYFCDLTGDGLPELCSTVSMGSGVIDDHVIIFDYANGASYTLEDRMTYDYSLRLNESDGQLYVDKKSYFGGGLVFSGRLAFQDNCIQILGQITNPEIVDIVDPTKDGSFSYDTALERFYEDGNNEYYFSGIYSQYVIVHYSDGTSEDISTALRNGRATLADLDKFDIRYWAEPKSTPFEAAISGAILDRYASDQPDGLIRVESHVLLANEGMGAAGVFDAGSQPEQVTAYLLVYHGKYSTYGGTLEAVSGSCVPTVITFSVDDSGAYLLEEYWEPRDGDFYAKDIREKFPGVSAEDALNADGYLEALMEDNYNKALDYLNDHVSVDARITELLDLIQTSPAHSSNPGDYIRAHGAEYEELIGYGEYTLRYCFTEFLRGGQIDLRGHIMALACQDIIPAMGERKEPLDNVIMTGQDWFDGYYGCAQVLAQNQSPEDLEKYYPATFLLLQVTGSAAS